MKKVIPFLLFAGVMILVPACKEKKRVSDDIITSKYTPKKPEAPIAQPARTDTSKVEWLKRKYMVTIERTPADSLPKVKDETGQLFIDNRITVSVIREDKTVFFRRSFTKSSFASYLDDYFRANAILGNMVFADAVGNDLRFAISVMMPESDDEFIPLTLTVSNLGNINIARDTDLDTISTQADSAGAAELSEE